MSSEGIGISEIANKGKHTEKTWLCPLCSNVSMAYGTSCKRHPECGQVLNANGRIYAKQEEKE